MKWQRDMISTPGWTVHHLFCPFSRLLWKKACAYFLGEPSSREFNARCTSHTEYDRDRTLFHTGYSVQRAVNEQCDRQTMLPDFLLFSATFGG